MNENIKILVKKLVGKNPLKILMKKTDYNTNLKEKIRSLVGIPITCQKIISKGRQLEDSELINFSLNKNINTVYLVFLNHPLIRKEINIKIEYKEIQKVLKINIDNWTSVYELKQNIFQNEKIQIENQNILYNDNILEDEKTLYYYGIKADSILNLQQKENLNKIKIYIKDEDQTSFNTYLVSPYEKIKELKNKIIKYENIKIFDYLNIYFLNKSGETGKFSEVILLDEYNLYDEFIGEEAQLVYSIFNFPKNSNDIKINIKGLVGNEYFIYVKQSDKLSFIIDIFCRLNKIKDNIDSIICICKGKKLEGNKRIQDYNIENNDTILIIGILRG